MMLTIWSWAIRPLPSVNGIVKTSGRVPAASAAVKVGAVQLYSSGSTVIHGYFASNSLIWRFSASTAAWVAPGRRTPTVMVTCSFPAFGSVLGATAPDEAAGALAGALGWSSRTPHAATSSATVAARAMAASRRG